MSLEMLKKGVNLIDPLLGSREILRIAAFHEKLMKAR
jgi:hypothetical protein